MMQPVQEAVWDMTSGGLGILGKDGSILTLDVISKDDGVFGVSQNDFAMFAMPIPAFAQHPRSTSPAFKAEVSRAN